MTGPTQPLPEPTPTDPEPVVEDVPVAEEGPPDGHPEPVLAAEPTPKPATLSIKDKIRAAKAPTRTVPICLATGLQEQYEHLHDQLREAVTNEAMDKRLSGGDSKRIAREIEALQEQMTEFVILFKLQALGPRRWEAMQKAHPAREGNNEDAMLGYNVDTFADAAIRACTVEPADLDAEDWQALLGNDDVDGKLTPHQFNSLWTSVLDLNIRRIDVPNSFAASRILRPSEDA